MRDPRVPLDLREQDERMYLRGWNDALEKLRTENSGLAAMALMVKLEDALNEVEALGDEIAKLRVEVARLRAENARIISWLRRNANAEQHPLVRQALIEAHNAALADQGKG